MWVGKNDENETFLFKIPRYLKEKCFYDNHEEIKYRKLCNAVLTLKTLNKF